MLANACLKILKRTSVDFTHDQTNCHNVIKVHCGSRVSIRKLGGKKSNLDEDICVVSI